MRLAYQARSHLCIAVLGISVRTFKDQNLENRDLQSRRCGRNFENNGMPEYLKDRETRRLYRSQKDSEMWSREKAVAPTNERFVCANIQSE